MTCSAFSLSQFIGSRKNCLGHIEAKWIWGKWKNNLKNRQWSLALYLHLLFHDAECIWDITLSYSRLKPSAMLGLHIWFRGKSCGVGLKNLSAFPRPAPQWMNVFVSISTTARKQAVIIWNMIVKKIQYEPLKNTCFLIKKENKNWLQELKNKSLSLISNLTKLVL